MFTDLRFWVLLQPSWDPRGAILGPFRRPHGARLGPLGAILGAFMSAINLYERSAVRALFCSAVGALVSALSGPSWDSLGATLRLSWGHLGTSWRSRGAVLGPLGAIWGALLSAISLYERTLWEPTLVQLLGVPCWFSWGHLGAILGLSWRHLCTSWRCPGAFSGPSVGYHSL